MINATNTNQVNLNTKVEGTSQQGTVATFAIDTSPLNPCEGVRVINTYTTSDSNNNVWALNFYR